MHSRYPRAPASTTANAESKESLNLFFCFRWLLVLFKREFTFEKIQRLWEVRPS